MVETEEFCVHELVIAQCAFCKPGRTKAKAKRVRTKSVAVDHLSNGDGTVTSTRFTTCTECQIPIVPGDAVIVNGVGWAHEDCWL